MNVCYYRILAILDGKISVGYVHRKDSNYTSGVVIAGHLIIVINC